MECNSCYDVVNDVIQEANEDLSPTFVPNSVKLSDLENTCWLIDTLARESELIACDVEIDEEKQEIYISLICPILIIENGMHGENDLPYAFEALSNRVKNIRFAGEEGGENIKITFTLPGIWDKVVN